MNKILIGVGALTIALFGAGGVRADKLSDLNTPHKLPSKNVHADAGAGGGGGNLANHGGPVIRSAKVVSIFWGPKWGTGGVDAATAQHIISFFGQFGTSSHYATITQYYDSTGSIQTANLGNTAWYDGSTPPANVTDAILQGEVTKYLTTGGGTFDASTIYEVFIQNGSYSSSGSSTSCGGTNLSYCAYHSHYSSGALSNVKYASMPYPSCGGCQATGFTTEQNFDHFSGHETREAVTDQDGNAWYDRRGYEADDKCAWSPAPFLDSGYGYQYEWSNAVSGCVK
jgi:hypothetical protein